MYQYINNFKNLRLLVVGDVMLDRYWSGDVNRISPEAPVPIVKINKMDERLGGAANVAKNLSDLGAKVSILTVIGSDDGGRKICDLLQAANVEQLIHIDEDVETTVKLRILGQQQLLRVDFESQPNHEILLSLIKEFKLRVSSFDGVVISDYGKGGLSHVNQMIRIANEFGIKVFVDPKGADYSKYSGASIITPNRAELKQVVGSWIDENDLTNKATQLIENLRLNALLLTRSEEGMTLYQLGKQPLHIHTKAQEVFDVSGAGDTVIATFALMDLAGASLEQCAILANEAAGEVVKKMGTATISIGELLHKFSAINDVCYSSLENLMPSLDHAKSLKQKIVMTNGCFDILHVGHVAYLEEAKKLGDKLIVAINTDDSVKRLKGDSRPINKLADRMKMLAALKSVDWVLPFDEDTPEKLINVIGPDILVKGGDYKISEISGADCVLRRGGDVKLIDFLDGYSTTKLIEKVRD